MIKIDIVTHVALTSIIGYLVSFVQWNDKIALCLSGYTSKLYI